MMKMPLLDPQDYPQAQVNPQAVGWDSGAPFPFNNFLVDILEPTSFKLSQASNSGL